MSLDRAACYDVPRHHRELFEEQETEAAKKTGKEGDLKAKGFSDGIMPELFHRMYSIAPNKVETVSTAATLRRKVHDLIDELPEFQTLRKQTQRDPIWSSMATEALSKSVVKALPAVQETPDADEANRILQGLLSLQEEGVPNLEEQVAEAKRKAEEAAKALQEQAAGLDESAVRSAARSAMQKTQEDIEQVESALQSFGYGAGTNAFKNPKVAIHLARKIAASPSLRKIAEMAGRLRTIARAKRSRKTEYARSEATGVEQTGDVSRLVPSEMLYLANPDTVQILTRRLVDRNAMGYRLHGKHKVGKGPVIVAIDQSGSMSGDKDVWAKGVALALLDAARADNRPFGVILYDDGVRKHLLVQDPAKVSPMELLDLLSTFSGGGTRFGPAMALAKKWIVEAGKFSKADIVHITDGEAEFEEGAFKAWATELGVSVFGIGIGLYNTHCLQSWCTEPVTAIRDVGQDTKAVDTIFDNM